MTDWDARYAAADGPMFGTKPNVYLRQLLARPDCTPRAALCLADGDGRNGRWLASEGLAVTAVDISSVGTDRAVAFDRAAGVTVERIAADLADWAPPVGRTYDLVALLALHCESEVRNRALRLAAAHLTPGGWIVIEGFARDPRPGYAMGPPDPDKRYDIDELIGVLDGLDVVEAMRGAVRLDEGRRHQGLADMVRVVARRAIT